MPSKVDLFTALKRPIFMAQQFQLENRLIAWISVLAAWWPGKVYVDAFRARFRFSIEQLGPSVADGLAMVLQ